MITQEKKIIQEKRDEFFKRSRTIFLSNKVVTYPDGNEIVKTLLKRENSISINYAIKRIEELEAEVERLKKELSEYSTIMEDELREALVESTPNKTCPHCGEDELGFYKGKLRCLCCKKFID